MQDKNLIKRYAAQNGLKSRRQCQSDDRYYNDGYNDDYNDEYGYYLYYINPKKGETVCVIFPNGENEIYIMPMKV